MNLYLLYWDDWNYDDYSHVLVVAENESEARAIHPHGQDYWRPNHSHCWCSKPEDVTTVTYIGKADDKFNRGDVVIASFHAG